MKDKEKQIMKLMKDKEFVKLVRLIENTQPFYVETIALQVYKKYQPKLPEDSVVLSREEYERLLACEHNLNVGRESYRRMEERAYATIEDLKNELKQSRKETAEKFYKKVRKLLKKVDIIVDGDEGLVGYEESAVDKGLTEIAKQLNVEIKE